MVVPAGGNHPYASARSGRGAGSSNAPKAAPRTETHANEQPTAVIHEVHAYLHAPWRAQPSDTD